MCSKMEVDFPEDASFETILSYLNEKENQNFGSALGDYLKALFIFEELRNPIREILNKEIFK